MINWWAQRRVYKSKEFERDKKEINGFYINDDANGSVSIHNDLTKAHKLADNSVLSTTMDDAKTVGAYVLGAEAVIAPTWGGAAGFYALEGAAPGVGVFSSTVLGAAAVTTGEAALVVAAVGAVVGGAVLAGDYVSNYFQKGTAQDDIKNASVVSLDGGLG